MENKVYVVTRGEYSDYGIEHIFSTREAAEKYCAIDKDKCYEPMIEEWNLEDGSNILIEQVYRAINFTLADKADSNPVWEMQYNDSPFTLEINMYNRGGSYYCFGEKTTYFGGTIPVSKTIETDEEASKIIFNHITKWKAEQLNL